MIITRLEIEGYNYPFSDELPISTTYQVADIREPDKRKSSFTKSIELKSTNELDKLFENIYEVNISLQTFNPNKKLSAKYFVNERLQLQGDLQLIKVNKEPLTGLISYSCNIIGLEGGLFKNIGDKYLEDLDFSAYDEVYSKSNIKASWSNVGSGLYYPHVQRYKFSQNDNVMQVEDYVPCFFLKEYIEKIITTNGYTIDYTDSILSYTDFEKIIVYPNIDGMALTTSELNNRQFYVGLNADYTLTANTAYVVDHPNESGDFFDLGGQVSGTYAVINESGKYNVAFNEALQFSFTHTVGTVTYAIVQGIVIQSLIQKSTDGGTTWTTLNSTSNYWDNTFPNTFNISTNYTFNNQCATGEIDLNSGDRLRHVAYFYYYNPYLTGAIKYYNASDVEVTTGTGTTTMKLLSGTGKTSFYMLCTAKYYTAGNTLSVNSALPKKIKQKDLLKSFMQAFNVYMEVDKYDKTKLYIQTYNDYYNDGTVNWENKIDKTKPLVDNPLFLIEGKNYLFKYTDDTDYYNDKYKTDWNETFGQENKIIDNDFLTETKTNQIIFSPTHNIANYDLLTANPKIFKLNELIKQPMTSNIRMLYAGGEISIGGSYQFYESGTATTETTIGYAGHTDDPFNPTYDLNFDYPKEVYYNFIQAHFTDNNLYNRFHRRMIENITDKNSKTRVCNLWLTPNDIENFSFRKKYFIDGAYWIVNSIKDYNPLVEQSTQVELIKVISDYVHVPSTSPTYSNPMPTGGAVYRTSQNNVNTINKLTISAAKSINTTDYIYLDEGTNHFDIVNIDTETFAYLPVLTSGLMTINVTGAGHSFHLYPQSGTIDGASSYTWTTPGSGSKNMIIINVPNGDTIVIA